MDRTDQRAEAEARLTKVAAIVDRLLKRADDGDVFFVQHRGVLDRLVAELAVWRNGQAGTKRILALKRLVDDELAGLEEAYRADTEAREERKRKAAANKEARRLQEARRLEAARTPPPAPIDTSDSIGVLYDMRNE